MNVRRRAFLAMEEAASRDALYYSELHRKLKDGSVDVQLRRLLGRDPAVKDALRGLDRLPWPEGTFHSSDHMTDAHFKASQGGMGLVVDADALVLPEAAGAMSGGERKRGQLACLPKADGSVLIVGTLEAAGGAAIITAICARP